MAFSVTAVVAAMMLLMLVELVALIHKNIHLLLPAVIQHLLMPLIEYRLLLLAALVLAPMVSIVYCLAFISRSSLESNFAYGCINSKLAVVAN